MPTTDLRTFARVGDGLRGTSRRAVRRRQRVERRRDAGGLVARRRGRVPRPLAATLTILLVALLWVGSAAARQAGAPSDDGAAVVPTRPDADRTSRSATATPAAEQAASAAGQQEPATGQQAPPAAGTPFAAVEGLRLVLPHPQPVAVAFHEANLAAALAMTPVGRLAANDNATKFQPPPDAAGPAYHVLSSRGRGRPATSAVDVVVPEGSPVRAAVTGRVVEAREYALPGGGRDWRVVVESRDQPHLSVVTIHLTAPQVRVGDEVVAGTTALGTVRQLPFTSHVDYVTGQRLPHAHLEVKASTPLEPVDPNAPALETEPAD